MTLLVAGVSQSTMWMVSDTAITGSGITLRKRTHQIKVIPSRDGFALIGFAGDQHHGTRLIENAASQPSRSRAVEVLADGHRRYPSVDFAYGHIDEGGAHLFQISEGTVREVPALYLGLPAAFEHFQRIRHNAEIDSTPEAIRAFVCGSRSAEPVPQPLSIAITSMLQLFAERSERDVAGWPVPYFLTKEGAFFCGYGYSVSDPILTKIGPGSIVPHGTAEAGGFGLSVTELGHAKGMVVYWLQQPGGTVFVRTSEGYDVHEFHGTPSQFRESAFSAIGEPVTLLFGDQPHGSPESIVVLRDEAGIPSMAIAKHGDSFSFSVLNVETPFRVRASVNLNPDSDAERPGGSLSSDQLSLNLSDDKSTATVGLLRDGKTATEITLHPAELDLIIAKLGEARAVMSEQIPTQPPQDAGRRELAVIDPVWRTDPPLHTGLDGVILRLRHLGYGWLTFILPHNEALSLGKWLCEYEEARARSGA